MYEAILKHQPSSPRATYGKARTLDKMADKHQSNEYLEAAISQLDKVLKLHEAPHALVKVAGRRLAERLTFRGWSNKAVSTLKWLSQQYPDDMELLRELGVSHLMVGGNDRARDVFTQLLAKDPTNGFAKVHLGFILATHDKELEKAVAFLRDGVDSGQDGTQDGRFYLHLGDSLLRLGREEEARDYFSRGADRGLFLSRWQRSLYNVDSLTGRPFWSHKETGVAAHLKVLEDNWETIRGEGLAQLNSRTGSFTSEDENLRDSGDWKQFTLYQRGRKDKANCAKVPRTCALLDQMPQATGCKRGQIKFSVMSPGIHVWPHVGPTNCRLRAHLGLVVPQGPVMRVTDIKVSWQEGKVFVFDDSFEHEVWHKGSELRMVLIVDFWHPELTHDQRRRLAPI